MGNYMWPDVAVVFYGMTEFLRFLCRVHMREVEDVECLEGNDLGFVLQPYFWTRMLMQWQSDQEMLKM